MVEDGSPLNLIEYIIHLRSNLFIYIGILSKEIEGYIS
jgi:hypothetical protein